jgi:hypothetical protein
MRYVDFEKGCTPSELVVKECEGLSLTSGKVKVEVKAQNKPKLFDIKVRSQITIKI